LMAVRTRLPSCARPTAIQPYRKIVWSVAASPCTNYREDISGPVPVSANLLLPSIRIPVPFDWAPHCARASSPRHSLTRVSHPGTPTRPRSNKPPACRLAAISKARSPREQPHSPTSQDKTRDTSSCQMNDGQFLPLAMRVQKPSFPHAAALSSSGNYPHHATPTAGCMASADPSEDVRSARGENGVESLDMRLASQVKLRRTEHDILCFHSPSFIARLPSMLSQLARVCPPERCRHLRYTDVCECVARCRRSSALPLEQYTGPLTVKMVQQLHLEDVRFSGFGVCTSVALATPRMHVEVRFQICVTVRGASATGTVQFDLNAGWILQHTDEERNDSRLHTRDAVVCPDHF